jgi:hypothetical protein
LRLRRAEKRSRLRETVSEAKPDPERLLSREAELRETVSLKRNRLRDFFQEKQN